jgi:NodT family efflux transporter outer membrane factor (OMF) lipoprotein
MKRARNRGHIGWQHALALTALLFAGCAVGPVFRRPRVPTPPHYRRPAQRAAGETGVPARYRQRVVLGAGSAGQWWRLFHSPQLDALITRALDDNHTVAAAAEALAEARQGVTIAGAARYPQIDGSLGTGRQKYGAAFLGPEHFPPFTYFAAGVSVAYELDYVGATRDRIEEQRSLEQYRRSELAATRLVLSGEVASQAVTIASVRARIRALDGLLRADRTNVNLVREAVAAGSEPRLDVLAAKTQLASDATLLPALYQRLAVARHSLAALLGRAPADWRQRDPTLGELPLPRRVPVTVPSRLLRRRPDILAAQAQLRAATAAVGVATANLYPQIELSTSLGQQGLQPGQLFDASSAAWSLIAGLTAPLFEGGRLHAERRAALDVLHERADLYQQVVVNAFRQVADALDALQHDAQLRAAQARALSLARRRLVLERESYLAGNTGLLPVLDAERQRERAELGLLDAEQRQYLDTIRLLLAAGGRVTPQRSRGRSGPRLRRTHGQKGALEPAPSAQ